MKILSINAVYGYRSTGVIVNDIHVFLLSQGIDSYVGFARGHFDSKTIKIGSYLDRKIHSVLSRLFGLQGYFSYIATNLFLKKIKKINPEIIHLHNLHDNYINMKSLLKYVIKTKKVLILTLHDCWYFTGKCTHFTSDNCNKWTERCGGCPRLKKDNRSWFFDKTRKMLVDKENLYNNIDKLGVIGVSNWITNTAKLSILRNAKLVRRIYNWVDIDSYREIPRDINPLIQIYGDKEVILGVASFWNKSKGVHKFIELSTRINNSQIIILIGNIGNMVLPENIVNVKEIKNDPELMSLYYSLATVTISFSLEESFGKTSIESLICGTPILVQNSTASPELVGDNCGYIINNQSIDEVIEYITKITTTGKKSYTSHCMKFAKDNFNKDKILKEHLDFYKEMLMD